MTIKRKANFFVYILRCADDTYYTGFTTDLNKRIFTHNSGQGSKYVRSRRPVVLIYSKHYSLYKSALKAERKIKKLSRAQKEKLIAGQSAAPEARLTAPVRKNRKKVLRAVFRPG